MEPTSGSPAIVRLAYREALSPLTTWRVKYELPINDPRFQAITEEEAIYDLTVGHFHAMALGETRDPNAAKIRELSEDVEKGKQWVDKAKSFLADENTQRALARVIHGGTPDELEAKNRPKTIRIRGSAKGDAVPRKKKAKRIKP